MSYFEPNERAWETFRILNENMRTIDNLEFYKTDFMFRKNNPEYDTNAVYAHFPKHKIPKNISRQEYSKKESTHAIFVSDYMFNNKEELEEVIVHEIIHFLDFNNITSLYHSNICNINKKLLLKEWDIVIDADAFNLALTAISNINRDNQHNFINPLNIDFYIEKFPNSDVKHTDSTLEVLRKVKYEGGKHKYMQDVRAFIGARLYLEFKKK